jgi:parallel beta-helix repeat protein
MNSRFSAGALRRRVRLLLGILLCTITFVPQPGLIPGWFRVPVAAAQEGISQITITTTSDVVDGDTASIGALAAVPGADNRVSLREALIAADATAPGPTISLRFNIPVSDTGYDAGTGTWRIRPFDLVLPAIDRGDILIDGASQPGFAGSPLIILDGYDVYTPDGTLFGLHLRSPRNVVRALIIVTFWDAAIAIDGVGATGNRIVGSVLGVDPVGTVDFPGYSGVEIRNGATGNTIGGALAADRNIIADHRAFGVQIRDAATQNNSVIGNWIGLDPEGNAAANGVAGVEINSGAAQNAIGGAGQGNVISGNPIGIKVVASPGNRILGNLIGLDPAGSAPLPNSDGGVFLLDGATDTQVGGSAPGERNVISGNGVLPTEYGQGIYIAASDRNIVTGNYIGVDVSGNVPLGNLSSGVLLLHEAEQNRIGGANPGEGNVIAYNGQGGVRVGTRPADNVIAGNLIGVGADGATRLGNQLHGIWIDGDHNTVGPANVIANSQLSGVLINGDLVTISQNRIVSNSASGICVTGVGALIESNTIEANGLEGTSGAGCNIRSGVVVYATFQALISDNTIRQNRIAGITISGGRGNRILANSISDNQQSGIRLVDGGNDAIAAPQVGGISGTRVVGQGCALCQIELFADSANEGRIFIGATTAAANGGFTHPVQFDMIRDKNLTATNTDLNGNTSTFAPAQPAVIPDLRFLYVPLLTE